MASTVFSAQFENLGELVKSLIFPVGVGTFPTELSGRLRHVFSPAGQVRKFCSVGGDVHKVSLFMSIQFASISKVIYIFADTLL